MNMLRASAKTCALTAAAAISLGSGCIGAQDTGAAASADANSSAATTPATTTSSALASAAQSSLNDAELQLLQNALADLTSGGMTGTPSLGDLKALGFHKRDLAVLALDMAAQQPNLTTGQSFALRLAKAVVSRDANSLEQVVLAEMLSLANAGTTTSAAAGATP